MAVSAAMQKPRLRITSVNCSARPMLCWKRSRELRFPGISSISKESGTPKSRYAFTFSARSGVRVHAAKRLFHVEVREAHLRLRQPASGGTSEGMLRSKRRSQAAEALKQKLAERGLKGKVRANQSGCLDQCEHGPTSWSTPTPSGTDTSQPPTWTKLSNVTSLRGQPVKRLMLADSCLNTATCEHRK